MEGRARRAEGQRASIDLPPRNAQGRGSSPRQSGQTMTAGQLTIVMGLSFAVYFFWLADKGR